MSDYRGAVCTTHDPETWFPTRPGGASPADRALHRFEVERARQLCAGCPALEQCRTDHIWDDYPGSIVGGMTLDQRRRYRERHGLVRPEWADGRKLKYGALSPDAMQARRRRAGRKAMSAQ